MPISHTAVVALNAPSDEVDLEAWLFGLSDADYQACAKGHRGAGVFTDEQGRGMINVESIGGNLIVQHYRSVHADRGYVEMYSPESRVYLLCRRRHNRYSADLGVMPSLFWVRAFHGRRSGQGGRHNRLSTTSGTS